MTSTETVKYPVSVRYNDAADRGALVKRLAEVHPGMHVWGFEKETRVQANGEEVRNAVLVASSVLARQPYFASEILQISEKAKPEEIDSIARREGKRLIEVRDNRALIAQLDTFTESIRDRFATLLKCAPWDIGLAIAWKHDDELGTGRINRIIIGRSPSKSVDADKRAEMWETLLDVVPGSSRGWSVDENPATGRVVLSYGKAPYLPPRFDEADLLPAVVDNTAWWKLAVGVSADGEPVVLNLKAGPHSLIVGGTGSGKSVLTRTVLVAALANGFDVVLIDPTKRAAGLNAFAPYSLGVYKTDAHEAAEVMEKVYSEVRRRVELIDKHNGEMWTDLPEEQRPKPLLVVIDEFASLVTVDAKPAAPKGTSLFDEWEAETMAKATVKSLTGKMAREARSAGVHLAIISQRADTEFIPGAIRENLGTSIHLVPPTDPPSSQSLTMVFGNRSATANEEIDKYNDGTSPGLAVAMIEGGKIQAFRVGIIEKDDITGYLESIGAPKRGRILDGYANITAPAELKKDERGRIKIPLPSAAVFNLWENRSAEDAPATPIAPATPEPPVFSLGDDDDE